MDWLENIFIDVYNKCVDFFNKFIFIRSNDPEVRIYNDRTDKENAETDRYNESDEEE